MNKLKTLPPETIHIVRDKGTEMPRSGIYNEFEDPGTYLCRQCGLALFRSTQKLLSSCGWPSFDDELPNVISRLPDPDGRRTEIVCARCAAHLGHVFEGEGITDKNLRHCVNSLSIEFVLDKDVVDTEEAIYAGGCFWGLQYLFDQGEGVLKTEVGYTGGTLESPHYKTVCSGTTGHFEAMRVIYDPLKTDYQTLTRFFLEIHDPTQRDGQGPDIGTQYKSAIFYLDNQQKQMAESLLDELKSKGFNVVTQILEAKTFWPAEEYHQQYYQKTGKAPYCHRKVKRF